MVVERRPLLRQCGGECQGHLSMNFLLLRVLVCMAILWMAVQLLVAAVRLVAMSLGALL
jgi:hypothetical protein